MIDFPILSIVIFIPLVGVITLLLLQQNTPQYDEQARYIALWTSSITFLVSLLLWIGFDKNDTSFQFIEYYSWIPSYDIAYYIGLDGISLFFVLLSTLLIPICVLASWRSITHNVRDYMIAFLLLEIMMVGMFSALDIFLFYIFFEAVLIPMYIIIGIWGGRNRIYASYKFFLYTLLGSVLMLIAMVALYYQGGTSHLPKLFGVSIPETMQYWMWLGFFASFAVKVPMWPVHTWLPDAHVEAPTAGSVILAGVLLKMGGYGFLRFNVPILPIATEYFAVFVFVLSAIAVVYTSLVALVQHDIKKLIAYSSIAHMAYVTAGIFAVNTQSVMGAIIQMLSHGLVSAALFLCVGVIYDRMHTREISDYGGLVHRMPHYALLFMFFTMASIGLPGTSGFVGEFLVLIGVYQISALLALLLGLGMILGAGYMLYMYRRVVFGNITHEPLKNITDIDKREIIIFIPLVILTLWMGIYPQTFIDIIEPASQRMLNFYYNGLHQ